MHNHTKTCTNVSHMIFEMGGIDGAHHKQWLLDQILREIHGRDYEQWVINYNNGDDGPNTFEWDVGCPP